MIKFIKKLLHKNEPKTNSYRNLPEAPRKIPMPPVKPPRYDYEKNIKNLIERYNNALSLLNEEYNDYEAVRETYSLIIHNLNDMLDELEV